MRSAGKMEARRFLDALKGLLKRRGITYAELAVELQCSLPTIKRALNNPTLPFSRLLEISELAHISFEELCERAEQIRPQHFVFTDEQDELFSERKELLTYFLELAVKGRAPSEIAEQYGLDEKSTGLYLKHLSCARLIDQQDGNRIRLLAMGPFGFRPQSRYLREEHEAFLKTIVSEVLTGDPGKTGRAIVLKDLTLSAGDYRQFLTEFERIIDRFSAISEGREKPPKTLPWKVAFASGPSPNVEIPDLPNIDR